MDEMLLLMLMAGWSAAQSVAWWMLGEPVAAARHTHVLVGLVVGMAAGVVVGLR